MKRSESLARLFVPGSYVLTLIQAKADTGAEGLVTITGQKMPPPSKRITLHQKGLKITGARIVRHDKKGDQEFSIARINHLPTFEQVRLHTKETLFPGPYEIIINFSPQPKLESKLPKRKLFPCIDEPSAWSGVQSISTSSIAS
ncbi:hypothetical protein HYS84_01795 [Candidatus Saccharibacteria bacterium]|nr:hypothetical protein [Candidatus Saccharibacteria bacterium]